MKPSRLVAVENLAMIVPPGSQTELRWFYGEVCKLTDISTNDSQLIFQSELLELRIGFSIDARIDPIPRRLTIAVPSLREAMEQLTERGIGFDRLSGFAITDRRVSVNDPSGNRVELKQEWPEAPL
jgi:hypothetical protein